MKRTGYGIPGDDGPDMVRMRGHALRLMHEADRSDEIEELQAQLEQIDAEDACNAEAVAIMIDAIAGLVDGSYRPQRQAYDPADERAVKVGHENPIAWVRAEEKRVKESKRRRRIS